MQRIQTEMIEKENEMYDKIVNLEEELRQAQLQNSLFANEVRLQIWIQVKEAELS